MIRTRPLGARPHCPSPAGLPTHSELWCASPSRHIRDPRTENAKKARARPQLGGWDPRIVGLDTRILSTPKNIEWGKGPEGVTSRAGGISSRRPMPVFPPMGARCSLVVTH